MKVRLRPACPSDARRLWIWANDSETRRASFNPGRIPWAEHVEWLRSRLASKSIRIYLGVGPGGRAVGQVRFEVDRPGRAVVSIVVAPAARGKGIGKLLLAQGLPRAAKDLRVRTVRAYVKSGNPASLALFRTGGFRRVRRLVRGGARSVLLSRPAR